MKPYIALIIALVAIVLVVIVFLLLFIRSYKKPHPLIGILKIGMMEQEMIEECGIPEQTIIIDANTKIVIYKRWKNILIFWRNKVELKITVKNGIITNITD